jgi:thiamine-monophosphate kinase
MTAIGTVRPRRILTRSGARAGDEVYVTGTLGEGFVGLKSLQARSGTDASDIRGPDAGADLQVGPFGRCEAKYLRPTPRVRAGLLLGRTRAASACVDLSDGLADGLRQIASASDVGISLDAGALPIADDVRRWHEERGNDPVMATITGGDDYELLFTVRGRTRGRLREARRLMGGLPITPIGVVTRARRMSIRTPDGERELPEGFEHFR